MDYLHDGLFRDMRTVLYPLEDKAQDPGVVYIGYRISDRIDGSSKSELDMSPYDEIAVSSAVGTGAEPADRGIVQKTLQIDCDGTAVYASVLQRKIPLSPVAFRYSAPTGLP